MNVFWNLQDLIASFLDNQSPSGFLAFRYTPEFLRNALFSIIPFHVSYHVCLCMWLCLFVCVCMHFRLLLVAILLHHGQHLVGFLSVCSSGPYLFTMSSASKLYSQLAVSSRLSARYSYPLLLLLILFASFLPLLHSPFGVFCCSNHMHIRLISWPTFGVNICIWEIC